MSIYLKDLFPIDKNDYSEWTICLNNANAEQVYSFSENPQRLLEHISWKRHRGSSVSFRNINTKYCLQFIRLDRDLKYNQWLFLGAFENCGVLDFPDEHQTYDLKNLDIFSGFSERLIVEYTKIQGPKQAKIDIANIETIRVVSVLEKNYVQCSRQFDGYDKVSRPFPELKKIITANVDNWRILLENVNCVYAITDTLTGKIYIGRTYGYNGTWQRWSDYVYTGGHGHDKELMRILATDSAYANNFLFSIVECFFNRNGNELYILEREKYWKDVFLTRKFGNNKN